MSWSPHGKRGFVCGGGRHACVNRLQAPGVAPHAAPLDDLLGRPIDDERADGRAWRIVSQFLRRTRERQVAAEVAG